MTFARSVFRLAAIVSALTLLAGFVSFRAGAFSGFTQHLRAAAGARRSLDERTGVSLSFNELPAKSLPDWTNLPDAESDEPDVAGSPMPAFLGNEETAYLWPSELPSTPEDEIAVHFLSQRSPQEARLPVDGELSTMIVIPSNEGITLPVEKLVPQHLPDYMQPEPPPVMVSTKSAVVWSPEDSAAVIEGLTPLVKDLTPLHLGVFAEHQGPATMMFSTKSAIVDWAPPPGNGERSANGEIQIEWLSSGLRGILKPEPATVLPGSKSGFGFVLEGLE